MAQVSEASNKLTQSECRQDHRKPVRHSEGVGLRGVTEQGDGGAASDRGKGGSRINNGRSKPPETRLPKPRQLALTRFEQTVNVRITPRIGAAHPIYSQEPSRQNFARPSVLADLEDSRCCQPSQCSHLGAGVLGGNLEL
ncbi:hypothetical protein BC834DRAFT_292932 [Gloeopeniophorella convolvens]|nr:hypothetical protein BC834DRAFT_292932 [Gloeopeniophorella convolvens]